MRSYLRIYADEDGESHFEDVDLAYHETDFVPPAPPVSTSSFRPASQFGFAIVPRVGTATGIRPRVVNS